MLGGPVYIAFIRFAVSLAGTILLFSILSESRFDKKKTAISYGCFCVAVIALGCIWYVADWERTQANLALYVRTGIKSIIREVSSLKKYPEKHSLSAVSENFSDNYSTV